jgi:hypothetical protein
LGQSPKFLQTNLSKKFEEAASSHTIQINKVVVDRKYPVIKTEQMSTKFGSTVLLNLKDEQYKIVKVFLPKRYSSVFSDEDIEFINLLKISLLLIYKGTCAQSKSYILAIK